LATSLIYKTGPGYELAMRFLYGRYYHSRYKTIADIIEQESSVLDLCCGPGTLFTRYLTQKRVQYAGLDLNPTFVKHLRSLGINAEVRDLRSDDPLPTADYVIMQASLYHFLPDPAPVLNRMLAAARLSAIIAEPVRNLALSDNRLIRLAGRFLTDPGSGEQASRFSESTLDAFFEAYGSRTSRILWIPGHREKIYVLTP
jgi:SAM-dependent methyltransferase